MLKKSFTEYTHFIEWTGLIKHIVGLWSLYYGGNSEIELIQFIRIKIIRLDRVAN